MSALIQRLDRPPSDDPAAALLQLGGKGASLLRLTGAGLPVPDGFVISTTAYRAFVEAHQLAEPIATSVATLEPAAAAKQIQRLFDEQPVPDAVAAAIDRAYREMERPRVAVRSSATAEDLPGLSFAGQQDSFLNVGGRRGLLDAVRRCWASLWNARAIGYRSEHGVREDGLALAVVVQRLVDADAAGVMFTADPVTGSSEVIQIESAWGLGEAVVSGQVTPDSFRVDARDHELVSSTVAEKAIMTVRTRLGTEQRPVPPSRRRLASMAADQIVELARIGQRIAELYNCEMDIEWCRRGDRLAIVQARPITTTPRIPADPWNDSLQVQCLWTRGNVGEAIPDVMSPATWCLVREFLADAMPTSAVPPYVAFGIVGGRLYLNLSMAASIARCAGIGERVFRVLTREVFGRLPESLSIPYLKLPPARVARLVVPVALSMTVHARRDARRLPAYLIDHPARCRQLRQTIERCDATAELALLWTKVIHPEFGEATAMLTAATRSDGPVLVTIRRSLQKVMGEADTERLLAGLGRDGDELASLGPLIGLEQLADGEIDAETYRERYGHRGPHEFEISLPRPAEDPDWLERTVAEQRTADYSVSELLRRQERARQAAWLRFSQRYPHRVANTRHKINRWTEISRRREEARSEVVRFFWVLRAFWVRAGELTGIGEEVFSYDWNEVIDLLEGRALEPDEVGRRRQAYADYRALPSYPGLISGRFAPFVWAADPDRPSGVFIEGDSGAAASTSKYDSVHDSAIIVTGSPGSAGVVEGVVCVLADADLGTFAGGDILVTSVTNVGWTPLFPRARAVITDIGAPLSHAAIVARELGIPAVVGCGDATTRLHTGDRVRVDGTRGTVELLTPAPARSALSCR